jgi:hypothetical protein
VVTSPPTHPPPHDPDLAAVIGPARLAYFTPVHEQPTLADRKAMFILAVSGLIATVLLFFAQPLEALIRGVSPAVSASLVVLLACLGASVLGAALLAYAAYRRPLPPMPPSLALFRNVAAEPLEDYVAAMRSLDHRRALRDMLHYNYSVATLAAQKFRLVNRSLACLRVALPLWMLLLLVLGVWG